MVMIVPGDLPAQGELVELYGAVGWAAYTEDPARLALAVANSTYVACLRDDDRLVGIVRGMSDEVSVFYLQDIIVHPDYQEQGHGKNLLEHILDRFAHVRQKVLLTDDEDRQHRLYRSAGYRDVQEIDALHAFVRFEKP
jgi:ribosomal protein S18 acetylase RimI-like enzyme